MNLSKTLLVLTLFVFGGCSDNSDQAAAEKPAEDHFLKEKTDTIDKAKQAEQMILDAAEQQKRKIDEQTQ